MRQRNSGRERFRGDPDLNEQRYGSEVGPRGRSKFSPRGNDQDWGGDNDRRVAGRFGRRSYDAEGPANFAGDMEEFGSTRRAQFGQGDYYGSGEHSARKFGATGRGRDQYFASDDDRDWDRGQIVRGPSTKRPQDAGERSTPRPWRTSREDLY
jgi:hypothetical protein